MLYFDTASASSAIARGNLKLTPTPHIAFPSPAAAGRIAPEKHKARKQMIDVMGV